jgi:hypothetical protein
MFGAGKYFSYINSNCSKKVEKDVKFSVQSVMRKSAFDKQSMIAGTESI